MAVLILAIIGSIQISYEQPVQPLPSLFPHDSKPFNVTMAKWLERYWNWTASIPKDVHPMGDTTGRYCGTNQNGPVWILDPPVGSSVEQTFYCEIPEGKAILFPVLVGECDDTVLTSPTDEQITECAKIGNDEARLQFSVDGNKLLAISKTSPDPKDYSLYRTISDFFNIFIIKNNRFDTDKTGYHRAQGDGYFVIMKPLSLGNHTIDHSAFSQHIDPLKKQYDVNVKDKFNIKIVRNQNSSS